MNCALFDKSTKFGTEVDQYIMNKFGCGAIGQLLPGGRGGHFEWRPFSKMAASGHPNVRQSLLLEVLVNFY